MISIKRLITGLLKLHAFKDYTEKPLFKLDSKALGTTVSISQNQNGVTKFTFDDEDYRPLCILGHCLWNGSSAEQCHVYRIQLEDNWVEICATCRGNVTAKYNPQVWILMGRKDIFSDAYGGDA